MECGALKVVKLDIVIYLFIYFNSIHNVKVSLAPSFSFKWLFSTFVDSLLLYLYNFYM